MAKSIVPLLVRRIVIDLGCGIELDAYTADEQRKDGSFINYLSGRGIAKALGITDSSVRLNRMSKELKSLLGKDFSVRRGEFKLRSGGLSEVGLWEVKDAITAFQYHGRKGNQRGIDIVFALAAASLDTIINDAFGRDYERGDTGRNVKDYLRNTPKEWDLHFDKKWQAAAVQCLGIPWQSRTMARFIVDYIYRELGIWEDLKALNPDPDNIRYFQYIEEVADNAVVKTHINTIYVLLCRSINRDQFKRIYDEFKSGYMQTSMF